MQRRPFILAAALSPLLPRAARAHHGWTGFDQTRPIYLEGRAVKVSWGNPHAEVDLELKPDLELPGDLAGRSLPSQQASVDGPALLKAARLPTRSDRRWEIELAPISRMQAWQVPQIKPGEALAVVGFTFPEEKGEPVLRAEYLFHAGKVYGLRSGPA